MHGIATVHRLQIARDAHMKCEDNLAFMRPLCDGMMKLIVTSPRDSMGLAVLGPSRLFPQESGARRRHPMQRILMMSISSYDAGKPRDQSDRFPAAQVR